MSAALGVDVIDRVRGTLWGLFIGDALAMPVHWYYDPADIKRHFGCIEKYEAPKAEHPSSIMHLSNTGGHGRGGQEGRIIGDVICHGKHKFWGVPKVHYHQGMAAGQNTLNALCARAVIRSMIVNGGEYSEAMWPEGYVTFMSNLGSHHDTYPKPIFDGSVHPKKSVKAFDLLVLSRVVMRSITANRGKYSEARWLKDYVSFMTTPGSHNDTYAESFHRDFFGNYATGVPPEQCAKGTEGHNTAQIGAFVMLPPVISAALPRGKPAVEKDALTHLRTTHDSQALEPKMKQFAALLCDVLQGTPVSQALAAAGVAQYADPEAEDLSVVYKKFGPACYIESSLPVAIHFLAKYRDDFKAGVLANANAGGESCHRGAVLGSLLGAAVGEKGIPGDLIKGLHAHDDITKEINGFVQAVQAQGKSLP